MKRLISYLSILLFWIAALNVAFPLYAGTINVVNNSGLVLGFTNTAYIGGQGDSEGTAADYSTASEAVSTSSITDNTYGYTWTVTPATIRVDEIRIYLGNTVEETAISVVIYNNTALVYSQAFTPTESAWNNITLTGSAASRSFLQNDVIYFGISFDSNGTIKTGYNNIASGNNYNLHGSAYLPNPATWVPVDLRRLQCYIKYVY